MTDQRTEQVILPEMELIAYTPRLRVAVCAANEAAVNTAAEELEAAGHMVTGFQFETWVTGETTDELIGDCCWITYALADDPPTIVDGSNNE